MPCSENTYCKLRSMLDSFERMAISYCRNAKDEAEAIERMEFIKNSIPLEKLSKELMDMQRMQAEQHPNCPPEAPFWCNGHCCIDPC